MSPQPPGSFVGPGRPVAVIEGGRAIINAGKIAAALYIGNQRWFSTDPRFGLVVLAQIASRALSPGINDPGTATLTFWILPRVCCSTGHAIDKPMRCGVRGKVMNRNFQTYDIRCHRSLNSSMMPSGQLPAMVGRLK